MSESVRDVLREMRLDGSLDYGDGADRIAGSTAVAWADRIEAALARLESERDEYKSASLSHLAAFEKLAREASPERKAFVEAAEALAPWFHVDSSGAWMWKEPGGNGPDELDAFARRDARLITFVMRYRAIARESGGKDG